jgi:hypothetical protein
MSNQTTRFPTMNTPPCSPSTPKQRMGLARLIADLDFIFQDPRWFSLKELLHLRGHFHRLVRHTYQTISNNGCIFGLLTEKRKGDSRITSREKLTRFFTGGCGEDYQEMPVYQPARWIVRAWDREGCERYAGVTLDRATLRAALDRAIEMRSHEAQRLPAAFASTVLTSA